LQRAKLGEAGEVAGVGGDDFDAAAGGAHRDQRIVGQAGAADAFVAVLVGDAVGFRDEYGAPSLRDSGKLLVALTPR